MQPDLPLRSLVRRRPYGVRRSVPGRADRGSVALSTMFFAFVMVILAYAVLQLGWTNYRIAMRNQLNAQARAVAESELEYVLYQFKTVVVNGASASTVPAALSGIADTIASSATDGTPTTDRSPFLQAHRDAGWRVRRSTQLFHTESGRIPGTTKIGTFTYIIAWVEVLPPVANIYANGVTARVGRRFVNSNTVIFQYSIFFQGDLELNPGTDTSIYGDIVANGNIYMAPLSGKALNIYGKVRYLSGDYFNSDATGAVVPYNPLAPNPGKAFGSPTFANGGQSVQLETLDAPENLLGGIDAVATAQNRADLFGPSGRTDPSVWSAAEHAAAENNVYRSLIVPPPAGSTSNEYPNATSSTPDDTVISSRRAYNRAQMIVNVETDGSVTFQTVVNGTVTDVTSTMTAAGALTSFPTGTAGRVSDYAKNVWDEREGKVVRTTEINVGSLVAALAPLNTNGLVYVNLKNSSATTPSAIRLTNGSDLSAMAATSSNPINSTGLSIATNGGIYIKGDFNTAQITDGGTTRNVPAMLEGDAITALSAGWTDSTTSRTLSGRVASANTTINGGLLTGNAASSGTNSSGGAQNLVRYEEDWSGKTVNYVGSLGRLFQSTQFVAPYGATEAQLEPDGTHRLIYNIPNRTFTFDNNMQTHRPPGSPETTAFSRGSFFTW